ncbi:hypothetical protein AAG906_010563 [Vitis piasezkii]
MDTSHLPITAHKLNGQNYLQWSQSILMFIRGKEKDDYITGASAAPETTASTYKRWIPKKSGHCKETFSNKENTSEIIQIEGILDDLRQGNLTNRIFQYSYSSMAQLDTFEIVEGSVCLNFVRFEQNLDEIGGRIMGVKPLPSLREAFSEVRREESRKNLMMGSHQQLNMAESSALKTQLAPFDNRQKIKGGRPWCDHCKKPGHSRETCWKIHGKPGDWKPRQPLEKEGQGNHEQMEMLQKLLSPLLSVQSQTGSSSNQVIGSGTLAHKGNFLSAFTAGKKRKKPWIVDSGASDHMTGDATIFDTYSSCPNNLTVRIADGSLSKVAGTGSVVLSRDLTLNSVLLVPNLDCVLLIFPPLTVNFDLDSGRRLAMLEECSGLYILKECHDPQEQPQMAVGSNSFRSLKCIFLGYSSNKKGYKCYSPVTRKFYNSMDVTFFETQPYYPKNDIQGENSTQEYQFWDLESFSESPITTENHIPPESFNQPESIVDLWDKEHIQEETEEGALSQQTHEAEPGPNPSKLPSNNAPNGTVDSESCTQHPIGNFISYDKLSPTFRAFTFSITRYKFLEYSRSFQVS